MKVYPAPVSTHIASRAGRRVRQLVRFDGISHLNGLTVTHGFWTGADHREFSINGQDELFIGAGAVISIPPIVTETGLKVRQHRVVLAPTAPEVENAVRNYDLRRQRVYLYDAYFHPETNDLLSDPVQTFKGEIDASPIDTAAQDGEPAVELTLLGGGQFLTRSLGIKKSDAGLRRRKPNDRIRRYTDISGSVDVFWGEVRATAPEEIAIDLPPGLTGSGPSTAPGGSRR